MKFSRRDLAALLPALVAEDASAQTRKAATLLSKDYHASQIPYTGDEKKKGRAFFRGAEHSGFNLEVHETILGAGHAIDQIPGQLPQTDLGTSQIGQHRDWMT